jgi:hypothetical protein
VAAAPGGPDLRRAPARAAEEGGGGSRRAAIASEAAGMTTERAIVKAILAYLNGLPGCLARKRWSEAWAWRATLTSTPASAAAACSSR